ncbi:hypothetical protein LCGC14_1644120 [marine sediment metagenome]|uniref:Transmembrane protein n=1 Tax=marine sediment metagenome TaxID=412755 RepID=A0A0F9KEP5_9ZZZZ
MENEQEQPKEEETKPKRDWFMIIYTILMFCGVCLFLVSLLYLASEEQDSNLEINESTYSETLQNCSATLTFYINQTPDFATCETQDECDLKQLRYGLLQQDALNCMETAWRER